MRIEIDTAPSAIKIVEEGAAICRGDCCEDLPEPPEVPETYSGFNTGSNSMKFEQAMDFTNGGAVPSGYVLQQGSTSKDITTDIGTITIANPSTNGRKITLIGSVTIMCEGEFHTDTHTHSHATYTEGYRYLCTAGGPSIELKSIPKINGNNLYSITASSGKEFYLALDTYTSKLPPVGSEDSGWDDNKWSRSVTLPIVYTINNPGSTNTITFETNVYGYNLHDANDATYNENIRVRILSGRVIIALAWILQ